MVKRASYEAPHYASEQICIFELYETQEYMYMCNSIKNNEAENSPIIFGKITSQLSQIPK
jgi:hypothetical protein